MGLAVVLAAIVADGVSAKSTTALTAQQQASALSKAAALRNRESKRDRSAAGATVDFGASAALLRASDALAPTPQPTESPFLVVGEKFLIFTKHHATLFLIIAIVGILIVCCPFIIIAVWCLYHDYGPAPPPYNSKKRACPPKGGLKAPLLAPPAGEAEQKVTEGA